MIQNCSESYKYVHGGNISLAAQKPTYLYVNYLGKSFHYACQVKSNSTSRLLILEINWNIIVLVSPMYDTAITGERRCSIGECKIYLFVNTLAKYIGIVENEKSNIEVN